MWGDFEATGETGVDELGPVCENARPRVGERASVGGPIWSRCRAGDSEDGKAADKVRACKLVVLRGDDRRGVAPACVPS